MRIQRGSAFGDHYHHAIAHPDLAAGATIAGHDAKVQAIQRADARILRDRDQHFRPVCKPCTLFAAAYVPWRRTNARYVYRVCAGQGGNYFNTLAPYHACDARSDARALALASRIKPRLCERSCNFDSALGNKVKG